MRLLFMKNNIQLQFAFVIHQHLVHLVIQVDHIDFITHIEQPCDDDEDGDKGVVEIEEEPLDAEEHAHIKEISAREREQPVIEADHQATYDKRKDALCKEVETPPEADELHLVIVIVILNKSLVLHNVLGLIPNL